MKDEEVILEFFGFENKHIAEVSYLIKTAKELDILEALHNQLYQFDKRENETYPIFYKRMFIGEISWRLNELVCAEYYPDTAIGHLEDFGLFFQDIWLDDEDDNVFLDFFLTNNLSDLSSKEMVELIFNKLQNIYELYFEVESEEVELNGMDILTKEIVNLIRTGKI